MFGLHGRTGGEFIGPAGSVLPMPFAGDGVTAWRGGELNALGAPPGTKAQLVDRNGIIVAEAVVGFGGKAQFFRTPACDFPVGKFPGLRLMLSTPGVVGPVLLPSAPMPDAPSRTAFPLFINSQNWHPLQYKGPHFNNVIFSLDGNTCMQLTRTNEPSKSTLPPLPRPGLRPRL